MVAVATSVGIHFLYLTSNFMEQTFSGHMAWEWGDLVSLASSI